MSGLSGRPPHNPQPAFAFCDTTFDCARPLIHDNESVDSSESRRIARTGINIDWHGTTDQQTGRSRQIGSAPHADERSRICTSAARRSRPISYDYGCI